LDRIEDSIILIQSQTKHIKSAENFILSPEGTFALSGVCMQLIYIGESLKSIDSKTNNQYLIRYPEIPWNDIMGLRNIIAHEYHRIDEEEIYLVITNELQPLLNMVQKMKSELFGLDL
jgi:uncharacterized protein with HEPN domain